MNPTRSPKIVPAGLVLIVSSALGVMLGGGCSSEKGPESGQETTGDDGLPEIDPATQDTLDKLFGPQETGPPKKRTSPYPDLALKAHNAGLPNQGTWRERPTLHDFTGDGRADLVGTNREEDGLNTWVAPGPDGGDWEHRIEGIPRDLMYGGSQAADLNGDGHQDLVYVAHGEGLMVFLGDGTMNWTIGDPLENPVLMVDVALGEFNGDGKLDAVGIGHFEGGLGIYLGDGEGGFDRMPESKMAMRRSNFGTQVETADMDGDGLDDVIVTADKGATVLYTRVEGQDGSTKPTWEDVSEGLPAPAIGNSLRGVMPGDFDGDGQLDLAICGLADPGIPGSERNDAGLYRLTEEGWVQFDSGIPHEAGYAYKDLDMGDFNHDGNLDLLLASGESGVMLLLGDGKGGLQVKGVVPDSFMVNDIAVGDVDGNGWLDIVIQSSDTKRVRDAGGLKIWLNSEDVWQ